MQKSNGAKTMGSRKASQAQQQQQDMSSEVMQGKKVTFNKNSTAQRRPQTGKPPPRSEPKINSDMTEVLTNGNYPARCTNQHEVGTPSEDPKITFDYLLQRVVENVSSAQKTTQAQTTLADDEPPVYRVNIDQEDHIEVTTNAVKEPMTPAAEERKVELFPTTTKDDFDDDDDDYSDIGVGSGTDYFRTDRGLNFGQTRREEDVIKTREAELLARAKLLENEMLEIRQAKVNSVLRQFEQQLQRDAKLEHQRIKEELNQEYDAQANDLEAEKTQSVDEINKLQAQLKDQIAFFTKVHSELETKKQDLLSTHQASVQYLRKEISQQEEVQKQKLMTHMAKKTEIFKTYIKEQAASGNLQ